MPLHCISNCQILKERDRLFCKVLFNIGPSWSDSLVIDQPVLRDILIQVAEDSVNKPVFWAKFNNKLTQVRHFRHTLNRTLRPISEFSKLILNFDSCSPRVTACT